MTALIVCCGIVVLLVILWLVGMHVRAYWWTREILVGSVPAAKADSGRTIVFLDGAFNLASEHASDIMEQLSKWGKVLYVDYNFKSYNHDAVYRAVRDAVRASGSREACFFGGSMGAINALRLVAALRRDFDRVTVIGVDAALCRQTLPNWQRQLSVLVHYIHPGPIWCWLFGWAPTVLFRGIPASHWEDISLTEQVRVHLAAMRRYNVNAFLEMTDAITRAPLPDAAKLQGIESVYLRSESDATIRSDIAEAIWLELFPDAMVRVVPRGEHLTFKEHPEAWRLAVDEGCGALFGE